MTLYRQTIIYKHCNSHFQPHRKKINNLPLEGHEQWPQSMTLWLYQLLSESNRTFGGVHNQARQSG